MDTQIKIPVLASAAPPFFEVYVGHQVKVFAMDDPLWVKLIYVEGDDLLGIVASRELRSDLHDLGWRDVIEFKRCHVFGLY
jgi:hypothetical protein